MHHQYRWIHEFLFLDCTYVSIFRLYSVVMFGQWFHLLLTWTMSRWNSWLHINLRVVSQRSAWPNWTLFVPDCHMTYFLTSQKKLTWSPRRSLLVILGLEVIIKVCFIVILILTPATDIYQFVLPEHRLLKDYLRSTSVADAAD